MDGKMAGGSRMRLSWGRSQPGSAARAAQGPQYAAAAYQQRRMGAAGFGYGGAAGYPAAATTMAMPPMTAGAAYAPPMPPIAAPAAMASAGPVASKPVNPYAPLDIGDANAAYLKRHPVVRVVMGWC